MTRATTLKRIGNVIQRSLSDRPDLLDMKFLKETTPLDHLGLDSLTVLDLVYDLQEEFHCGGDLRDLAGLQTVGDLAAYLEANEGNDA